MNLFQRLFRKNKRFISVNMDCTKISNDEFNRHTRQFIHIMRQEGVYNRQYRSQKDDGSGKEDHVDTPDEIIKSFHEDAPELIKLLANPENAHLHYSLNPFFTETSEKVKVPEMLQDWRLFFGTLGLRYLCFLRVSDNQIQKVLRAFYKESTDLINSSTKNG